MYLCNTSYIMIKKYHIVGRVPQYNSKIVGRGKIDTPNTQVRDSSLPCLGTDTSMKSGRVKLIVWNTSY